MSRFSKRYLGRVELFCLFVACMHFQRSVITQWYHVFLVGYGPTYPKFSEATNDQYLWKGSSDFADFFQLLICILLNIHYPLKLFWAGILRHSVSANQIVRCFKLTNFKNSMRYYVDFLLPLKLKEMSYNFGLWPQNTLGQSDCRIFLLLTCVTC